MTSKSGGSLRPQFGTTGHGKRPRLVVPEKYPPGFVLLIDSRETLPLFKKGAYKNVPKARVALPIGDYSLKGFERTIAVERKSVNDLTGWIFTPRCEHQIRNMLQLERKYLLIEARDERTLAQKVIDLREAGYTQVHYNSVLHGLYKINARFGIEIVYKTRSDARRWILRLFKHYYLWKRKG